MVWSHLHQNVVVLGHMNNFTYVHFCLLRCDAYSGTSVLNFRRNMLLFLLGTLYFVQCRRFWVVNTGTLSNVGHKCGRLCARLAICLSAKIFTLTFQSKQQEWKKRLQGEGPGTYEPAQVLFPCQEMNKKVLAMSSLLQSYLTSSKKNVKGDGRYCASIQQTTINMSQYLVSETPKQWSQQLIWPWSQIFIHSFIHSFCCPSYDRVIASSKANSPQRTN